MDAYHYQATLLCDECGPNLQREIRAQNRGPMHPADEWMYTSDDYPTGPIPDGGGPADCPQHCDRCGVFLENPINETEEV